MCVGEREQGWVSAERRAQGSAAVGYLPGGPQGFQAALSQPCPPSSCPHAFSLPSHKIGHVFTRCSLCIEAAGDEGRRRAPLARGLYTHALKIEHRTQGRHIMCSFHVLMQSPSPEISRFGRSVLFSSEAPSSF